MDKEISSWALLANQGHDIDSLKKKILCYRCKSSLKHIEEFFAYKIRGFQTAVSERTPANSEEVLLRDYQFSHFCDNCCGGET
jgi:hypothetical protein